MKAKLILALSAMLICALSIFALSTSAMTATWEPIDQYARMGGSFFVVVADQQLCMVRVAAYTNPMAFVFEFALKGNDGRGTAMAFIPSNFGPPYSIEKVYWEPFDFTDDEVGWVPAICDGP